VRSRRKCAELVRLQLTRKFVGIRHNEVAQRQKGVPSFRQVGRSQLLAPGYLRLFWYPRKKCADPNRPDSGRDGKPFKVNEKLTMPLIVVRLRGQKNCAPRRALNNASFLDGPRRISAQAMPQSWLGLASPFGRSTGFPAAHDY
jgi:hypothetical protein